MSIESHPKMIVFGVNPFDFLSDINSKLYSGSGEIKKVFGQAYQDYSLSLNKINLLQIRVATGNVTVRNREGEITTIDLSSILHTQDYREIFEKLLKEATCVTQKDIS